MKTNISYIKLLRNVAPVAAVALLALAMTNCERRDLWVYGDQFKQVLLNIDWRNYMRDEVLYPYEPDPDGMTVWYFPINGQATGRKSYRFTTDEGLGDYKSKTTEEKAEEQKLLKNLGAYRDGRSQYHFNTSGQKYYFLGNERTYRRILCQTYIDSSQDHYLRFRVASDGKQGNNNEFMLDFFEMVPKSVYSVDGDGDMEDDL